MRISDWSSDVCSSDLQVVEREQMVLPLAVQHQQQDLLFQAAHDLRAEVGGLRRHALLHRRGDTLLDFLIGDALFLGPVLHRQVEAEQTQHLLRSDEHTSELQSLMRTSYAVFCLKKKKTP